MKTIEKQKGSIVAYILGALFLMGLLFATFSQTSNKSSDASQVEKDFQILKSDIESLHSAIAECIQIYSKHADVNDDGTVDAVDNPNPPFPLYEDLTSGDAGESITQIKCPGAPSSNNDIIKGEQDTKLITLSSSSAYSARYFNHATDGVYIRITSSLHDALWEEILSRLDGSFAKCSAEIVSDSGDCEGGCLYYWLSKPDTNTIGNEEGCH